MLQILQTEEIAKLSDEQRAIRAADIRDWKITEAQNKHGVPEAQWQTWNIWARKSFNRMHHFLTEHPSLHAKWPNLSESDWHEIAWKAATGFAEMVNTGKVGVPGVFSV